MFYFIKNNIKIKCSHRHEIEFISSFLKFLSVKSNGFSVVCIISCNTSKNDSARCGRIGQNTILILVCMCEKLCTTCYSCLMSIWSALDSKLALIFKICLLIHRLKLQLHLNDQNEEVRYVFSVKFYLGSHKTWLTIANSNHLTSKNIIQNMLKNI
jgi:hypothetical protein